MAKVIEGKKIQKRRTEDELHAALTAFSMGMQQTSIPAQMDDSDVVLRDCIAELLESRQKLEDVRGWMRTWLATDTRK